MVCPKAKPGYMLLLASPNTGVHRRGGFFKKKYLMVDELNEQGGGG